MEKFDIHILGCGSALPTTRHQATSQVLNIREKLFMIDCGEGAQVQLRRAKLKFSRLNHIFISHLHGDHCFGLMGLISTFGMLERTADLHIHAHADLQRLLEPQLEFFCKGMPYQVVFHPFNPGERTVIYDDRSVSVETIPLRHRLPTCGFLFREKPTPNHIRRDMIDFYGVPICMMNRIKNGEDYTLEDGRVIPNSELTTPSDPPRAYAYCSDTVYLPRIAAQVLEWICCSMKLPLQKAKPSAPNRPCTPPLHRLPGLPRRTGETSAHRSLLCPLRRREGSARRGPSHLPRHTGRRRGTENLTLRS